MFSITVIPLLALFSALETVSAADTVPFSPCPLLGPRFPIVHSIHTSPIIKEGLKNLSDALNLYVNTANGTFGEITPNTTSFSISVFSADDSNTTDPFFFEYHHTASSLKNANKGVTKVNKDSVYRIGDLSTLFTVWIFLIEAGEEYLDDPV